MKQVQALTCTLQGTNGEIGEKLGTMALGSAPLRMHHTAGFEGFGGQEAEQARALFNRWCPGLCEELDSFAACLGVQEEQVVYYAMTYLRPGCSQMALLGSKTEHGRPLLARNYEFSSEAEDFALVKTCVKGRYAHLGTSVMLFGRDDGFNEHGLAVSMSSCGFPVGPLPFMRGPKVKGLQFWAVIRALLENCRDVKEALEYLQGMPIAYNLNLMLLDKAGNAALVETLDGGMEVKSIGPGSEEQYLYATNHPHLPQMAKREPMAMRNSLVRYAGIGEFLASRGKLGEKELREMLLKKYPEGLCCHYFKEYFGTTKSMLVDPVEGSIQLCWGGRVENGWSKYYLQNELPDTARCIELNLETPNPKLFEFVPLEG